MNMFSRRAQDIIGKFSKGDLYISTVSCEDTEHLFETAIAHPKYNDGLLIIVEEYDTRLEAQDSHAKWIDIMTAIELPACLKDVNTSDLRKLARKKGIPSEYWNSDIVTK